MGTQGFCMQPVADTTAASDTEETLRSVFTEVYSLVIDHEANDGTKEQPEGCTYRSNFEALEVETVRKLLEPLSSVKADVDMLRIVPIGKLLNKLRKSFPDDTVSSFCATTVKRWKSEIALDTASAKVAEKSSKAQKPCSVKTGDGEPSQEYREAVLRMKTRESLKSLVASHGRSASSFEVGDTIHVFDKMQRGSYKYTLKAPMGKEFDPRFEPVYSPEEMLSMGVFEGKYLNDCVHEFPKEWFEHSMRRLSPQYPSTGCNRFPIKSRQPLNTWKSNGWLPPNDPRGWFQW